MISGVTGRNHGDGRYELKRTFDSHFRNEHPEMGKVGGIVMQGYY